MLFISVPCSSSSAIIEYPALDSQMSASQNSHFPSSLELFSQNGSSCSAPLPIAHLTNGSLSKPTSDPAGHGQVKVPTLHIELSVCVTLNVWYFRKIKGII